jgi:hypothetical protein
VASEGGERRKGEKVSKKHFRDDCDSANLGEVLLITYSVGINTPFSMCINLIKYSFTSKQFLRFPHFFLLYCCCFHRIERKTQESAEGKLCVCVCNKMTEREREEMKHTTYEEADEKFSSKRAQTPFI